MYGKFNLPSVVSLRLLRLSYVPLEITGKRRASKSSRLFPSVVGTKANSSRFTSPSKSSNTAIRIDSTPTVLDLRS